MKKPLKCVLSVYTNSDTAVADTGQKTSMSSICYKAH